jgi:hypothetical protein
VPGGYVFAVAVEGMKYIFHADLYPAVTPYRYWSSMAAKGARAFHFSFISTGEA